MPPAFTRRGLLGMGASAGMASLAGCGFLDGASSAMTTPGVPAYVVYTDGSTVELMDGQSGEVVRSGEAGREDARVIQAGLSNLAPDGGTLYITRGTYDIRNVPEESAGLAVRADFTILAGDFPHLRFHDHGSRSPQLDLTIHDRRHVQLAGLHLDGNRTERASPTRTLDIADSEYISVLNCIVEGGRSRKLEGGAGYGIGPYQVDHLTVDNCLIRNNDRHGIHPGADDEPLEGFRFTNNTFRHNASNPTGAAVDIRDGSARGIVAHNYFGENGVGLRIKGADPPSGFLQVSNNVFWDNRFQAADREAYPDADATTKQLSVSGSTFDVIDVTGNLFGFSPEVDLHENAQHVLVARPDGDSLRIRGNYFRGGREEAVGFWSEGRSVATADLSNNVFETPGSAIGFGGGVGTAIVSDNRFDLGSDGEGLVGGSGLHRGLVGNNVVLGGTLGELEATDVVTNGNVTL